MPSPSFESDFPMLKTTGCFAFVDDDRSYLEVLQLTLESQVPVSFFVAPAEFSNLEEALARTRELLEWERTELHGIFDAQCVELSNQADTAAERCLRYFADRRRLDMFIGLFCDFMMPVENGVSLCARHALPGLQRTLLTGVADEHEGIRAFNGHAIDSYMRKASSTLSSDLCQQFGYQAVRSGARRGELLCTSVNASVRKVLAQPETADAVLLYLEQRGICEYIVLGNPQGIVGVTGDGRATWFQLETRESLDEQLEWLPDAGWSEEAQRRVATGQSIVSEQFFLQLNRKAIEADAFVLCHSPLLSIAQFPLGGLPARLRPAVRAPDAGASA